MSRSLIYIPTYGVCLMGTSMVIMFLIILFLCYLLKKAKSTEYKFFDNQDKISADKVKLNRQESNDVPSMTTVICPVSAITECDSIKVEEPYFKHTGSIRDICRNDVTTPNRDKYLSKPILKKSMTSNVILPEQMRQICRDVLSKRLVSNSTSSKDLNELINEVENFERRPSGSKKGLAREKSASTPELDIYETLSPNASIPVEIPEVVVNFHSRNETTPKETKKEEPSNDTSSKKDNTNACNNEVDMEDGHDIYDSPPVRSIEHDKDIPLYDSPPVRSTGNNDDIPLYDSPPVRSTENDDDIPLYDSPPVTSLKGPIVEDSQYLLPLRSTPNSQEPSYINANRSYML